MLELEKSSAELMQAIDEGRARLRKLLAGRDEEKLATRPANGDWSVLEHVRHLLFAEQGLARFTPDGIRLSPLGWANDGLRRKFPVVGSVTPSGTGEVFDAWDAVHRPLAPLAALDTPEVRLALAKDLRHLRGHIAIIERQVRESGA